MLLLLRVLQGLSTGCEIVVSVAYLVEHAPGHRRGSWGGLHMATMALGFAAGAAAVSVVAALLPPDALASWGWRLPFVVALPLGLVALVLRGRVLETPAYPALGAEASRVWERPVKALAPERGTVLRGFLLTGGFMASFTTWFVWVPAYLATEHHVPLTQALSAAAGGLVVLTLSAVASRRLSDSWGRCPVIVAGVAVVGVTWPVALPAVGGGSVAVYASASVAMGAGLGAVVLQSTLAEAFPPQLRAAGVAVTVGLASAVVASTAPLVAERLVGAAPSPLTAYAVAWLVVAGWAAITLRPRALARLVVER